MNLHRHYRLPTEEEIQLCADQLPGWIKPHITFGELVEKIRKTLPDPTIGNHAWVVWKLSEMQRITVRFGPDEAWRMDLDARNNLVVVHNAGNGQSGYEFQSKIYPVRS